MSVGEFWRAWLGRRWFREALEFKEAALEKSYRVLLTTFEHLMELIDRHHRRRLPVYLSVQPYASRDRVVAIEKLFFEFDHEPDPSLAVREAFTLAGALRQYYGVKPLVCRSGCKGAHVYVWLREPVEIDGLDELAREVYHRLQLKILRGLEFKTLDPKVLGDLKRLARLPYTMHERTGRLCFPLDEEGKPVYLTAEDLEDYREHGLNPDLLELVVREVLAESKVKPRDSSPGSFRDVRSLVKRLMETFPGREPPHHERLIVLFELIKAGWTDEQIHKVFKECVDYDPRKTQYMIDHARKHGYKPYRTRQILELVPWLREGRE